MALEQWPKRGAGNHLFCKASLVDLRFRVIRSFKHKGLGAGWRLHALTGDLKGFLSISVNGNWRVVFRFIEQDVELVDYLDYH